MNANLTIPENKGVMFTTSLGDTIRVCDKSMLYSINPAWHKTGTVYSKGMPPMEALSMLDPQGNMETWLEPICTRQILPDGKIRLIEQPFAMICRNPAADSTDGHPIVFGKPVYVGSMSAEMWAEKNANPARPTRSTNYELVTPSVVFRMVQEDLRNEFGDGVLLESAGFLGKHGVKGFFLSVKLPKWDKDVAELLDSAVDEYFHVYVDPRAMIHIYNTSIIAVCQNTVMFGIAKASRILRVDQTEGATERVRIAIGDMWGGAMNTRQMAQEAATYLATQPFTEDEMVEVANTVYRMPERPDPTFRAKSSWDARMDDYKFKVEVVDAFRETMVDMFVNPKLQHMVGITPAVAGTAWAGYQAVTGMLTYQPRKNEGRHFEQMFAGGIKRQMMDGYDAIRILKDPSYVPAKYDVPEGEELELA